MAPNKIQKDWTLIFILSTQALLSTQEKNVQLP